MNVRRAAAASPSPPFEGGEGRGEEGHSAHNIQRPSAHGHPSSLVLRGRLREFSVLRPLIQWQWSRTLGVFPTNIATFVGHLCPSNLRVPRSDLFRIPE